MSWSKLKSDEPELYYQSGAIEYEEIAEALKIVFERMVENKNADGAGDAHAIIFMVNATNGYIQMAWYDASKETMLGTWIYDVTLKDLWNISLEHDEGASFFDDECHYAICDFAQIAIEYNDGIPACTVFSKYETGDITEIIV